MGPLVGSLAPKIASGSHVETTARVLEMWSADDDLPDWWTAGEPRGRGRP
jgi:hypothetical protein